MIFFDYTLHSLNRSRYSSLSLIILYLSSSIWWFDFSLHRDLVVNFDIWWSTLIILQIAISLGLHRDLVVLRLGSEIGFGGITEIGFGVWFFDWVLQIKNIIGSSIKIRRSLLEIYKIGDSLEMRSCKKEHVSRLISDDEDKFKPFHLYREIAYSSACSMDKQIKSYGAKAGVVLNPGTLLSAIEYILDSIKGLLKNGHLGDLLSLAWRKRKIKEETIERMGLDEELLLEFFRDYITDSKVENRLRTPTELRDLASSESPDSFTLVYMNIFETQPDCPVVQECKEIYKNTLIDGDPPKRGFVYSKVKCLTQHKGYLWRNFK